MAGDRSEVSHNGCNRSMDCRMRLETLPEEHPLLEVACSWEGDVTQIEGGKPEGASLASCLEEKKAELGAMSVDGLDLYLGKVWTMIDLCSSQILQLTRELHQERQYREHGESAVANNHSDLLDLWSAVCHERSERENAIDCLKSKFTTFEEAMVRDQSGLEKEVGDLTQCMDVESKQREVLQTVDACSIFRCPSVQVLETFDEAELSESKEMLDLPLCSDVKSKQCEVHEAVARTELLELQEVADQLIWAMDQSTQDSIGLLQADIRSLASSQSDTLERSNQMQDEQKPLLDSKAVAGANSIEIATEASPVPEEARLPVLNPTKAAKVPNLVGFYEALSLSPPNSAPNSRRSSKEQLPPTASPLTTPSNTRRSSKEHVHPQGGLEENITPRRAVAPNVGAKRITSRSPFVTSTVDATSMRPTPTSHMLTHTCVGPALIIPSSATSSPLPRSFRELRGEVSRRRNSSAEAPPRHPSADLSRRNHSIAEVPLSHPSATPATRRYSAPPVVPRSQISSGRSSSELSRTNLAQSDVARNKIVGTHR